MQEYKRELAAEWPCAFSEQSPDLHANFVLGSRAVAYARQWGSADLLGAYDSIHEVGRDAYNELSLIREKAGAIVDSRDPWDIEHAASMRRQLRRMICTTHQGLAPPIPLPEELPSPDIQYDVVKWMAVASDKHLLTFLDWNERRLRPIQERLFERTARMQPFIARDIRERLVAAGLLPENVFADGLLENAMQATVVHVMDPFQNPGAAGYFSCGPDRPPTIGVLDECVDNGELYRVLFHEYIHSIGLYVQTLQRFYGADPEHIATVLDEAFVEHLTVAGMYGDPNIIAPRLRGYQGVYRGERDFMATITKACSLKLSELGRAYCEPIASDDATYHDTLRQKAEDRSAQLFPERLPLYIGAIVAKQYNSAPSPAKRSTDLAQWTQEIAKRGRTAESLA